jgi:hypothetical protein
MDLRLVLIPLIVLPMGLVTAVTVVEAWRGQRQANAARAWQHTVGQVIESSVRETMVRTRVRPAAIRFRLAKRYAPHVSYVYEVNEARYENDRLGLGHVLLSSDLRDAEREAARYAVGSPVTVYYDPANPAVATLDPRTSLGTRIMWLVALALLVLTVVVVVVLLSGPPWGR